MGHAFGPFRITHPIRRRGLIDLYAASSAGTPCIVLRPNANAPRPTARDSLARIAAAHRAPPSPHFPPLLDSGDVDGEPFVALASAAALDLEALVACLADADDTLPHGAAIPMIDALLDAFTNLHTIDPHPTPLGALAYANVLLAVDGEVSVVGLGHNFPCLTSSGRPALVPGLSAAPELLTGAAATEASDVYALLGLVRSLLPYAETDPKLREGLIGAAPSALVTGLEVLLGRGLHAFPDQRDLDMAGLRDAMRGLRPLHGVAADIDAHQLRFCGLISELVEQRRAEHFARAEFAISPDHRRVRLDDGPVLDLSRRASLRRILSCLVDHRLAGGSYLDWPALLEAGWPGEKVSPESGRGRVHVAIYSLRKLGLEDVVIRRDEGYTLHPEMQLRIAHDLM